jgi:hypothetical protein
VITDTPIRDLDVRASHDLIATYDDYGEAQRAVDRLADERFPVDRLRIVTDGPGSRHLEGYELLGDAGIAGKARARLYR